MLETELLEYDSRALDDGPFMHSAPLPITARHAYGESTETHASPFITDRETEGGTVQAEAPHECKCSGRQPVQEAVGETELAGESGGWAGEVAACAAGCPEPSEAYRKTIRRKGDPEGSVIDRTKGDRNVNLALQLFDYDVNEYRLAKNNHRNAIATVTEFVVKRLAQTNQPIAVTITGSTSRTGAASYNDLLSCKRAECVADNLRVGADRFKGFAARVQINNQGEGFTKATCKGSDCELGEFRSVLVQVHSPGNPPPPIPPVDPGCKPHGMRSCSFHTKTLQQALLGDLLNKVLPNVPDGLKSKLLGLIKKGIDKLARRLAPQLSAELKALLLLFPAEILREEGVFEVTELCQPNVRTAVLCYTGFGLRLAVPLNLDDFLDQALSGPALGRLPAVAKKALKELVKKAIPKAVLDRVQPIDSDSPGPVAEFDLEKPRNIGVFSGRVLVGKDIFFPGKVDLEFASPPWGVPDPVRRPHIVNCRNAVCTGGGGIKLTVGAGKGMELFAVSIGDLVAGPCVCGPPVAARELETEMWSETYGETANEALEQSESEFFSEVERANEAAMGGEAEVAGETGYEAENEAGYEAENETQFETEAAAEMTTEAEAETETETEAATETATEVETEGWTFQSESFESDPYAPIRSAMSPEHANLAAEEVTLLLGGAPARVALHQLLNSPAAQQVALASMLGNAARQSVRVDGADISVPGYLRVMSRLCREVAEEYDVPTEGSKPTPPSPPRGIQKYKDDLSRGAFYTFFKSALQGVAARPRLKPAQKAALAEAIADAAVLVSQSHAVKIDCAMNAVTDMDSKDQLARALNLSGPWGDAFNGALQATAGSDTKSPQQPVADAVDIADQAVLASGHLDGGLWNTYMNCKRH